MVDAKMVDSSQCDAMRCNPNQKEFERISLTNWFFCRSKKGNLSTAKAFDNDHVCSKYEAEQKPEDKHRVTSSQKQFCSSRSTKTKATTASITIREYLHWRSLPALSIDFLEHLLFEYRSFRTKSILHGFSLFLYRLSLSPHTHTHTHIHKTALPLPSRPTSTLLFLSDTENPPGTLPTSSPVGTIAH